MISSAARTRHRHAAPGGEWMVGQPRHQHEISVWKGGRSGRMTDGLDPARFAVSCRTDSRPRPRSGRCAQRHPRPRSARRILGSCGSTLTCEPRAPRPGQVGRSDASSTARERRALTARERSGPIRVRHPGLAVSSRVRRMPVWVRRNKAGSVFPPPPPGCQPSRSRPW